MTSLWHPGAKRVTIPSANLGEFTGPRRPKCVWHTTEGGTIEGAVSAYHASGSIPHFTIAHVNGKRVLYQHAPINRSVTTLKHPTGTPHTNRAWAYQVEIVGFARDSAGWSDSKYHYLHLLAEWLNRHAGVPMTEGVVWQHPAKIGDFVGYTGHCGHVHVPYNDHVDPGTGFHINKVI
jgi:hypothetical protein